MKKIILITIFNFLGFLTFQAQINDSLVAHYPLNGNANDVVGNNNGTVNGAALTTDRFGNTNNAYLFDGIDDWVSIGNTPNLAITGDITVSAWVKTPTSWPITPHDPMIYARYTNSLTNPTGVNLFLNNPHLSSRDFGFILKTGFNSWGNDFAVSTSVLQLDTWYFVVGVREGNVVKMYLNGVLEGTDIGSSSPINYGANPIASIGEKNATAVTWYDGTIDDIRIYKRALAAGEVQTLFASTVSVKSNNSVENYFSIYPNPTSDYLKFKTEESDLVKKIIIMNIEGQIVLDKLYDGKEIDVQNLKEGVYFIQIFSGDEIIGYSKFIKN